MLSQTLIRKLIFVFVTALLLWSPSPFPNTILNSGQVHAQKGCIELTNKMIITQDTTFCSKSYSFTDKEEDGVIEIGADDIVVDGNGLTLDGKNRSGYGIYLNGHSGVTLRNFNITRYFYAIRLEEAEDLLVENNKVWDNGDKVMPYYDINQPLALAYGGGILVNLTENSVFNHNAGWEQNVCFDIYHSSGNTITHSNCSNNFAWGIRLYGSTANRVSNNQTDFNHVSKLRTDRQRGCRGAFCSARDSTGILLVYGSHHNTISGNSIIGGGNGFFIGNEHGLPSNHNLIENNVASAIHNAFESTFSEGNIFRGNIARDSDFGFWLGFSHHNTVEHNTIINNRIDGIHWEHGRFGTIVGNDISGNGRLGLALTLYPNHWLIERYPGSEASHHYLISGNSVVDNGLYGLYFRHTTDSEVQNNLIAGNSINLYFSGDSINNVVTQNSILCTSASERSCQYSAFNNMDTGKDVNAENNWWGVNDGHVIGDLGVFDNRDEPTKGLIDYDPWLTSDRKR